MVVAPANGMLYAGQEDIGIGRMRADLTGTPKLIDKVREYGVPGTYDEETEECTPGIDPGFGGTKVSADAEGLTLLTESDGDGYILASSQGDNTFAAYDRELEDASEYEGGFRVAAPNDTLDGSEECDGAAVLNAPLGSKYPNGLLVVQDGHDAPGDGDPTNFTFVDLAKGRTGSARRHSRERHGSTWRDAESAIGVRRARPGLANRVTGSSRPANPRPPGTSPGRRSGGDGRCSPGRPPGRCSCTRRSGPPSRRTRPCRPRACA